MAATCTSVDQFLRAVRKSGLVDNQQLDAYLGQLAAQAPLPENPQQLASLLVRDGVVTSFQAQQFLLGKSRGFLIGGKYKLLEFLGAGGMGNVFLCEHVHMRRLVAVKVLPDEQTRDAAAVSRFYREARAVASLDHPNIVRAHDIDRDGKVHFIVMEYVDGNSLQEIAGRHGPMAIPRASHYVRQAACGLQHAFECGWVHRDIKPGNLLLDRLGVVKILDMGLARLLLEQATEEEAKNLLGTADYLAPEQAVNSHEVDIRADIYSLGAAFYFVLTGQPPFGKGSAAQKLIWHQMRQPTPLRTLRPQVPKNLAAIVERMMAKDPARRYQTPAEIVEALAPWTESEIPLPPEQEMRPLSPAAQRLLQAEASRASGITSSRRTGLSLLPPGSSANGKSAAHAGEAAPSRGTAKRARAGSTNGRWGPEDKASPRRPRTLWLAAVAGVVLVAGLATGGYLLFFADRTPPAAKKDNTGKIISPVEAVHQVNQDCTVEMQVKATGQSPTLIFLNSEPDYRKDTNFTAVIPQAAVDRFKKAAIDDPMTYFHGKKIQVSGTVTLFNNRPQIRVNDPKQIRIVD